MFNGRVFTAEFIGTFALVFIGAGAGVAGAGLLGVALAHGLVVATFAYVYGHISGAHFNPAVTFGLALNKTVRWADAVYYWVAQFLGAGLAAGVLRAMVMAIDYGDFSGADVFAVSTVTSAQLTSAQPYLALGVEAILTFFLVNAILHAAVAGKAGSFAGLAIGLTLVFAILAGGPMTGASLNPARTFGPALFTGGLSNPMTYLIYFVGPLLGSAVAVGVFKFLNASEPQPEPVKPSKKK